MGGKVLVVLERNLIMANEFAGQLIKGRTARVSACTAGSLGQGRIYSAANNISWPCRNLLAEFLKKTIVGSIIYGLFVTYTTRRKKGR